MSKLGRLADCTCPDSTPPGQYATGCAACDDYHQYLQSLGLRTRRCGAHLSLVTYCHRQHGHHGPHATDERQGRITWRDERSEWSGMERWNG